MEHWYEQVRRFGQVNLTEEDSSSCDVDYWRNYWRETHTQAVILNGGGIVAYYPSQYEEQYRARGLDDRDLLGEFVSAARSEGLSIIIRMDINRVLDSRAEWIARKADGSAYERQGRKVCCVCGPYILKRVPEMLEEIITRYKPDGFADNSWTGLSRDEICYCENCQKRFKQKTGLELPRDNLDTSYHHWIRWSYQVRMENWDLFNRVVQKAGGSDCLWIGMVNANFVSGHINFCDLREMSHRARLILVDHQSRDGNGFEQNGINGLLLHQLAGWDKPVAESMGLYTRGLQSFRRSANPRLETELWMYEGFSGGLMPWWHIVGASQQDKRIAQRGVQIMNWHKEHESLLTHRTPLASVGILWSQENVEIYGGNQREERVGHAFHGITTSLVRAGIPFIPIHADDITSQADQCSLLILPELGVISASQSAALKRYVKKGGSLLALGCIGRYDESGNIWQEPPLAALFNIQHTEAPIKPIQPSRDWEKSALHNYIQITALTHPVFSDFVDTKILPMGGTPQKTYALQGTSVLATLLSSFPIYPPEFSYPSSEEHSQPVLTEYVTGYGGKCMYVHWDLDSSFGRCGLPDHGILLANLERYLLDGKSVAEIEADGMVDMKVYQQNHRILIHLINLNFSGQNYAEHCWPQKNIQIRLRLPGMHIREVKSTEEYSYLTFGYVADEYKIVLSLEGTHQLLILDS